MHSSHKIRTLLNISIDWLVVLQLDTSKQLANNENVSFLKIDMSIFTRQRIKKKKSFV